MGKYEEALERARKGKPIDEIFPELKESEDEKIRKWLIHKIESMYVIDCIVKDENAEKALAWLEKQKEHKPIKFPDVSDVSEEELITEYSSVLYKTIQHYIDGRTNFTELLVRADAEINFFHLRRRLSKALDDRYEDGYQEGIASSKATERSKEQPTDAKVERVIKAARRVLNNWLDGTDCPDVSGDFAELEFAFREYDKEVTL